MEGLSWVFVKKFRVMSFVEKRDLLGENSPALSNVLGYYLACCFYFVIVDFLLVDIFQNIFIFKTGKTLSLFSGLGFKIIKGAFQYLIFVIAVRFCIVWFTFLYLRLVPCCFRNLVLGVVFGLD